jgi:hypothetical protein
MKSKQPENPLKTMEEQLDRILFNENNKSVNINKQSLGDVNKSIKEMKKHLIFLVKELKAKNLHLVA